VLILGDFKSFAPEVLILVKFKFMRMSEIGGFWKILEVLILIEIKTRRMSSSERSWEC
jgi:hypothetical protein